MSRDGFAWGVSLPPPRQAGTAARGFTPIFAPLCFLVPLCSRGEERQWHSNNLLIERQSGFIKIISIYKIL